ncbi:MFS transporter [Sutterella sp.]|uniref:MFS transporter n=1 Tax=Sutterella sp. TaxID=1981025 RepID=UPI0026DF7064|nr:MFS transporter [Sutterella sp.]MDO5532504.1 MFS transporter [Sutterella sp.]
MTTLTVQPDRSSQAMAAGILALVAASHFLNDMLQSLIPAALPLLKDANGLTFAEVGLITLTVQITSSLMQPLVGWATDKRPIPAALPVGMLSTLVGLILLARADSLPAILCAVALFGCGSAIFHPESTRAVQLAAAGRKGFAQAVFQVGGNAGMALGPVAAALIIIPNGQGSISWFAPVAAVAAVLLIRVATWTAGQVRASAAKRRTQGAAVARANLVPIFVILFVLMFSKQVYISSLQNFLTFFSMDRYGADAVTAQFVLFAFLAASAAGTIAGGFITDRISRRTVMILSIVGAAPFAILLPHTGFALMVTLAVIVSFIMSAAFSAILVSAFEAAPGHTGIISGVFFGFCFGLGGVATAFFGWLADGIGLENVFVIASFTPLLGIAAFALPKDI